MLNLIVAGIWILGPYVAAFILRITLPHRPIVTSIVLVMATAWLSFMCVFVAEYTAGRERGGTDYGTPHDTQIAWRATTQMMEHYAPFLRAFAVAISVLTAFLIIDAFRIKRLMLTSPGDVRRPRHATRRTA